MNDLFLKQLVTPQNIVMDMMLNLNYASFKLPRGGGKDFLFSNYALMTATSMPDTRVLITTPSYAQAKSNFITIYDQLVDMKVFKFSSSIGYYASFLTLPNGSKIKAEANQDHMVSESGIRQDIILVNEANSIDGDWLYKLLKCVEAGLYKKVFLIYSGDSIKHMVSSNFINVIEANENFSSASFGYKAFPEGFFGESVIEAMSEKPEKMDKDDEFGLGGFPFCMV